MYQLLRALLFRLEPETAHNLTLALLRVASLAPFQAGLTWAYEAPVRPVRAFGLTFKNPVGLAAGYDKDGLAVYGLAALGFGHLEVGTVTPRPQPGNTRPRVFRLVEDQAVINRMGFPGRGAAYVLRRLSVLRQPRSYVLGLNLGKNKDTPLEAAAQDYLELLHNFTSLVDYLAINVSSPNTVGLRRLQGREMLEQLLGAIASEREQVRLSRGGYCPVLVKLAPDITDAELEDAIGVILDQGMDGIIATNTTLAREGLRSPRREEAGGLSGQPLGARSEALLEKIIRYAGGKVPIISVGGIMSPADARRRLDMGAALVQVYTGLVYRGPGLVKEILEYLPAPA